MKELTRKSFILLSDENQNIYNLNSEMALILMIKAKGMVLTTE